MTVVEAETETKTMEVEPKVADATLDEVAKETTTKQTVNLDISLDAVIKKNTQDRKKQNRKKNKGKKRKFQQQNNYTTYYPPMHMAPVPQAAAPIHVGQKFNEIATFHALHKHELLFSQYLIFFSAAIQNSKDTAF